MRTKHLVATIILFIFSMSNLLAIVTYHDDWWVIPFNTGSTPCGGEEFRSVTFSTSLEIEMKRYLIIRSNSATNHSGTVINSSDGDGGWINACETCTGKTYTIIDDAVLPYGDYHYWVKSEANSKFWGGTDYHYLGKYSHSPPLSEDWSSQVANYVKTSSTSSNPSSYSWYEESNIKQGVQISLLSNDEADIFIEHNNNVIEFNTRKVNLFIDLKVNINNQGWTTLYNGSSKLSYIWQGSSTFSLGDHTMKVRWTHSPSGQIYDRTYHIHVVPASSKLFKDNYCNTLRLWQGDVTDDAIPIVISEGFDAYNTSPSQFIASAGNDLINCLKNAGFKVYILNYKFNSQDMRNNAAVYSSVINYVSAINNNKPVIAGGISMGGIIARYAVSKAEGIGSPLPISKFVTIDSPHQGAVISSTLQDYLKNNSGNSYSQHGLNNPAARQLLTYNPYGSIQTSFYNELNSLNGDGYPHNIETIGVSFSTTLSNPYSGKWIEIRVSGLAGVIDFLDDKVQYDFDGYLSNEEKQAGSYLPELGLADYRPGPWSYAATTQTKYPTFIPHNSSLDIVNGQSKFDITIQPSVTGFHDVVPSEIIEPLMNQLIKDNVYIQNKTINSTKYYIGKEITAGNNVTNSLPTGDVTITGSADVTFHATKSIHLKPGFSAGPGFHAFIAPVSCNTPQAQQYRIGNNSDTIPKVTAVNEEIVLTVISNDDSNKPLSDIRVNIYPNPTKNSIYLAYRLNEEEQVAISIIDIKGQQMQEIITNKSKGWNNDEIDLKTYPKGIYFIQFRSKDKTITKKVIKL